MEGGRADSRHRHADPPRLFVYHLTLPAKWPRDSWQFRLSTSTSHPRRQRWLTIAQRASPPCVTPTPRPAGGWQIIHQTGPRDQPATTELYGKLGIPAVVTPFVDPVQPVLQQSDLAICRAGGSTLAELAAAGRPAVLLPWPGSSDDHQLRNAEVVSQSGAARLVNQQKLTGRLDDALADALADLLTHAALRDGLARRMRRLARPAAAWHVATMVLDAATAPAGSIAV